VEQNHLLEAKKLQAPPAPSAYPAALSRTNSSRRQTLLAVTTALTSSISELMT
jgi:hypothetical protein